MSSSDRSYFTWIQNGKKHKVEIDDYTIEFHNDRGVENLNFNKIMISGSIKCLVVNDLISEELGVPKVQKN